MTGSRPDAVTRAPFAASSFEHGVVVHYHEVGLKGRNRGYFERRLVDNLEGALGGCEHDGVTVLSGRSVVRSKSPPSDHTLDRIGSTFGVATFAPCIVCRPETEDMGTAALSLLERVRFDAFAVAARRATKNLPLTSRQINVELGSRIQAATGADVDLDTPDVTVHVEVVGGQALVYVDKRKGPGGLPVGVSGRVVSLLSGGIDSPVATYRALKRGARATLCHFHSAPFTDGSSMRKAKSLAEMCSRWQGATTIYFVAIGEAQREVVAAAPPALRVVLYRRLMVRISEGVAVKVGAKALVLGDSLGQVASQTLENMACVDAVASLPVLRPLIGFDKQEIISEAQRIGTYETSILPYEDCCSLFVPKSPATRADDQSCHQAESDLDIDALVTGCLDDAEVVKIDRRPCGE